MSLGETNAVTVGIGDLEEGDAWEVMVRRESDNGLAVEQRGDGVQPSQRDATDLAGLSGGRILPSRCGTPRSYRNSSAARPAAASSTAGTVKVNRVPSPGPPLSAQMRPPCASTMPLQIGSPDPSRPCRRSDPRFSSREKLRNRLGSSSGRHSPALVGNGDRHVEPLPHDVDRDGRRLRRVPGRVGEEVVQDLDDAPPVRHHPRRQRPPDHPRSARSGSTTGPAPTPRTGCAA